MALESRGAPIDTDADNSHDASSTEDGDRSWSSATSASLEPDVLPLPPPSKQPSQVLDVDKPTPDGWVPRDPRLIRLTGTHPFNAEAPLSDLFDEGFLTSPELFYVRNHGPVPQVADEACLDWELSVDGMVERPFSITLRQLIAEYENVTLPITLVCAGNRRKEQNMVRKSKGFSWGPAGVSTALFTGVSIIDLLKQARPRKKARYVCMEGADELPNGHYATSIKLNWAMDPNRGILLAHMMNGEPLRPDHGKPLRIVIPGQIGGRSVKWLRKITLMEEPSDNWYHIYDNRVLPTMVTPEEAANKKDWWTDERYAIYDLSPNSAIAHPAHGESLDLTQAPETYRCKGYAYGGGGRRISRVEVSSNQGRSWKLATLEYFEDIYREAQSEELFGGKLDMSWREACFCWCFWSLDVPLDELRSARDLVVRAMDEGMCVQPRDMYWNVMGMMNNPWYRVAISTEEGVLRFEHPTQPALMAGGWMERVKKAGGDLTNGYWGEQIRGEDTLQPLAKDEDDTPMTRTGLNNPITIDQLRDHKGSHDPWFVVKGEVYEGTKFLNEHPGGAQSIISAAATDATDEFLAIHSETAKGMMPKYHIGTLDSASQAALSSIATADEATPGEQRPTLLRPGVWATAKIESKRKVSWDTRVFTFTLDHPEQTLGMAVGQHLWLRLRDPATRELIIRAYTPISTVTARGKAEVLVKIYNATNGRPGGKMSVSLDGLPIGHSVDFKGPIGKFEYLGRGRYSLKGETYHISRFLMICGGSGVTPIYQIFRAVMQDPDDETTCVVLDGNRSEEDILCKRELDSLAAAGPGKAKLCYTLTEPQGDWQGERGRVNRELIESQVGKYQVGTAALVCGPKAMEAAVEIALVELGWDAADIIFF